MESMHVELAWCLTVITVLVIVRAQITAITMMTTFRSHRSHAMTPGEAFYIVLVCVVGIWAMLMLWK